MKYKLCHGCNKVQPRSNFGLRYDRPNKQVRSLCKTCSSVRACRWITLNRQHRKETRKKYYKRCPWARVYVNIMSRVGDRNRSYYKRGIKSFLTITDLKKLWIRDKAHLLIEPSIDRKDGRGNYTFNNCRFIELKENISRERST